MINLKTQLADISCEIIAKVGAAKGLFVEAIRSAMDGNNEVAKRQIAEGEEIFREGRKLHSTLLTKFANGEEVTVDILLVHAQCQMMSAEDFKVIAEQFVYNGERE